jgi:outer membrane immunogenic protein
MKKVFLGTLALVALSSGVPVIAADMAARPVVATPAAFSWTGCHLGGLFGYGSGHSDGYTATAASTIATPGPDAVLPFAGQRRSNDFNLTGFTGGGDVGCDYQLGAWVVGVEGDWSNLNWEGQAYNAPGTTLPIAFTTPPGLINRTVFEAQERWFATARGRVGYAVDKYLFYVTGGAAWTKIDTSLYCIVCFTTAASGFGPAGTPVGAVVSNEFQADRRAGYVVGAGAEYAINNHGWSIRSEYLYVSVPSYTTFTTPTGVALGGQVNNLSTKLYNVIWRAGLTYKFGNYAARP